MHKKREHSTITAFSGFWRPEAFVIALLFAPMLGHATPVMEVLGIDSQTIANDAAATAARGTDYQGRVKDSTTTHTFTIKNTGDSDLNISGFNRSGSLRFSVNRTTTTLSANETHTFTVSFNPTTEDAFSAAVTIFSDDGEVTLDDYVINLTQQSAVALETSTIHGHVCLSTCGCG